MIGSKNQSIFRQYSLYKVSFTLNTISRGGVEVERSPHMREIVVRFPVATDLSRKKTGSDSSTAKRSATGESVTGPSR